MIKIENLTKSFGNNIIIDDLSLTLPTKGLVAITGASGIGKSTLLSVIADLSSFEKGKVIFEDDEKISFAFQSPTLLSSFTALENVTIATKVSKEEATKVLNELGIEEVNKYPKELSGGMAARVNLARALSTHSNAYLLDEPLASLDEETSIKVLEVIKRKSKESLCLMVIHDKETANEIADLIIDIKESPISNKNIEIKNK